MTSQKNQKSGKTGNSIVRSSAAEYLTFIAASGEGGVEAVYAADARNSRIKEAKVSRRRA